MFKKFILMVLVAFLLGLANPGFAESKEEVLFVHDFGSRYIFHGIDFLPNNHPINTFGLVIGKGKFSSFLYQSFGENYFEMGVLLEQGFTLKNLDFKTVLFPFAWRFGGEKADWGAVIGEEVSIQTLLNPTLSYFYAWTPNNPEWNGHYFVLGLSKDVLGFGCNANIGYNKGFFVEDAEGFSGMIGVSKTIKIIKNLSTDLFFRYFWNDPDINENEPVFGICTTFTFFQNVKK